MKRNRLVVTSLVLAALLATVSAQPALSEQSEVARVEGPPLFSTALPREEFAARRAKVLEKIGDGIARKRARAREGRRSLGPARLA